MEQIRNRAFRIKRWIETGLIPRLAGRKQVRYLGWDVATEKLDDAVKRQGDHPAKVLALDWLTREPALPERFSLLDVGCGPGVLAGMIQRHPSLSGRISYTGIDQSDSALERCRATYKGDFQFLKVNLQADPLPDRYDVVTINEVIEHLPHYREVIDLALGLRPKVFILTTFGAIPGLRRDRVRWNQRHQSYMNSYSFEKLYEFLRARTDQLWVGDLGTQDFERYWFPRKTILVFYLRLSEPKIIWTGEGWASPE